MKMKKLLSVFLVLALMTTCITGCTAEEKKTVLKVGNMPVAVGAPLQYAFDQGWFKDAGIDVEMVVFPTGVPINEAMGANELDISVIGLAGVYGLASNVSRWIGEANIAGGCGLYARADSEIAAVSGQISGHPNILGSAETISGKQFLVPLGTSAQYNVIKYVEKFGLDVSDVTLVQMEYGPGLQAFLSGQGDVYAGGPPFTFQAEEAGGVCISTHEDATDSLLIDGIIARADICESRKDDIIKFLEIYYRAAQMMADDEELRFQVSMEFFNANGREYDDKALWQEIAAKRFITPSMLASDDFVYGQGLFDMANFFTADGKVRTEDLPNVVRNIDPSFLEQALNISINKVEG